MEKKKFDRNKHTMSLKDAKKAGFRVVANEREFHSIFKHKEECNVNQIKPRHRQFFLTQKAAHDARLDACGHCVGRYKSKKNDTNRRKNARSAAAA